jgi:hypothetical protein
MNWSEFFSAQPGIAKAANNITRSLQRLFPSTPLDVNAVFPSTGEIDWHWLGHLVTWQALGKLSTTVQPNPSGEVKWSYVAQTRVGEDHILVFKSTRGDLARLPTSFVYALLRNETLSANLIESPIEAGTYLVQPTKLTEAELPVSLLDFLLDLRRKGEGTGFLRSVNTTTVMQAPIGDGTPRPVERPMMCQPHEDPQTQDPQTVDGVDP